jgi:L-lactate dehydrogenase complex protein LldG
MTVPSPRDEILTRVRTALRAAGPRTAEIHRDYDRSSTLDDLAGLFAERLTEYDATVVMTTLDGLPGALREQVRGRVVVPAGLPLEVEGAVLESGLRPDELDGFDTAVTTCATACAPTGTIVLDGSPGQGRRALSLVPDRHVCIVHSGQITGSVPELLARLDARAPLTFVSGPSATSDIELTRVKGVHGPRQLVVLLVKT